MTPTNRWLGLKSLIEDAVENGSRVVERVHRATAQRPFDLLEQIPPITLPVKAVRLLHDAIVTTVYTSIRVGSRSTSKIVDVIAAYQINLTTG